MQKAIKLRSLKRDEMFTLKDICQPCGKQVWIKDEFDHSTKKYLAVNFDDISKSRQFSGDTLVYVDFWF